MKNLLLLSVICIVFSCNPPAKTNEMNIDSLRFAMEEEVQDSIPADEQPRQAIIDDSDLDSISRRLDVPLAKYLKKWVRLTKDSAGFYIFQPIDGQIPYVEISQENGVYILALASSQLNQYYAITDFETANDRIIVTGVYWNSDNKRYGTPEDYFPHKKTFSFYDKEKGILKDMEGEYYVNSESKASYRLVEERGVEM